MTAIDLSGVRAVLFDAVGTVIYPDPPVAVAYALAGERFDVQLQPDEARRRFAAAFARQEALDGAESQWRTSEARERGRWRSIVAEVFPEAADGEGLFAALWEHFAEPRHWGVYPDVAACWRRLAERGLIVGLASNFDARLDGIVRGLPALAGCRHVFTSSGLGWRKPARAFFDAIADRLALRSDEIALVGDDLENDARGARQAGWRGVLLLRDPGEGRSPAGIAAVEGLQALG